MNRRNLIMRTLGILLSLFMITSSSCAVVDQILGPQVAAQQSFDQWAGTASIPYRNVRYETLTDDGTYATVRVLCELRRSPEAEWVEHQGEVNCRKVGQEWQCDQWIDFAPTDVVGATAQLEERESNWVYLIKGPGTGYYIPRIFSQYGGAEGIDINHKETWVNSRLAFWFEGLDNLVHHLQTKEGRDQLAEITERVGQKTGSTTIQERAGILNDIFGDRQYTNEDELLNGFFGQELGYSQMELAIFRGALNLWRTGEATMEFEGETTTFKEIVNRYNQENQIEVKPLP